MKQIVLKNKSPSGTPLEVVYLPEMGMNMISFKNGNIEAIDQSTRPLFEERFAGLGALIGPHFHHRRKESIPSIKDESLFPHIQRVKAKGVEEPFSHGIARYAPWKAEATPTKVSAVLTGKDMWNGVPLADLEGQNFKMSFNAELLPTGLSIDFSVVSDADSLVGIHYYYHLPNGRGKVSARVQKNMFQNKVLTTIPNEWLDNQQMLTYNCDAPIDCTFFPFPNPLEGQIVLETDTHQLTTSYSCLSQENSWQLYHPADSSYVCIEPISSQDPRHPNLSVSSLHIHLQIIPERGQHA